MGWRCNVCETVNGDETIICEVCNGISPFLAYFHCEHIDLKHAKILWRAENADEVIALYNGQKHKITHWHKAKIRLNRPVSIIAIILNNKITKRTYTFGIPEQT